MVETVFEDDVVDVKPTNEAVDEPKDEAIQGDEQEAPPESAEAPEEKLAEEEQHRIIKEIGLLSEGPEKLFRSMGLPEFVYRHNEKIALKSLLEKCKYIGVFFSASWCTPCTKLLPTLVDVYNTINKTLYGEENADRTSSDPQAFEIILMPCDNNRKEYEEYYKKMPFCTVEYKGISFFRSICSGHHEIDTIPTLVIYSADGKLMTKEGVEAVTYDKNLDNFPWEGYKTPMKEHIKQFILSKLPLLLMVAFMLWRNYTNHQSMKNSTTTDTTTTTAIVDVFDHLDEL